MVVGYVLGARWDLIETKLKRVDLAVGLLIVLALVALGLRFYLRRRRAASSDSAV
jgi:membrane protein DedA with SNARE-associated domain